MSEPLASISVIPLLAFILFFVLQQLQPRRKIEKPDSVRWLHHGLLFIINNLLMRLIVPFTLISVANYTAQQQWGLLNQLPHAGGMAVFIICFLLLDCAVYWQHVLTHKINFLWQIHKVHHTDMQMDVTTAIRFHPIELLLSLLYKSAIVLILGAPVMVVALFEVALVAGAAFNHSNWALAAKADTVLRKVLVTPDVHRAHHSIYPQEQNSNYGFFLIFWDKLFQTYTALPEDGHQSMQIGLVSSRDSRDNQPIQQILLTPFYK